ncbi:helix-turn-helix domain-containing protein [Allostella humosa]|uniref:helix-turn-helix domain-containing protein n=1 Tax=Stella humosa TaxID=94 RepID=UPI000F4C4E0B|nr:helix-turn-helix domain-containing protein [Stella humosa]
MLDQPAQPSTRSDDDVPRLPSGHVVTPDVDELTAHLLSIGWAVEYNQLSGGRFSVALDGVANGRVQMVRHRHIRSFVGSGFVPPDAYTFGVLVAGEGPMLINHQGIDRDTLTVRHPHEGIGFKLPVSAHFLTIAAEAGRVDQLADVLFGQRMSQMLRRGQVFPSVNERIVALARQFLPGARDEPGHSPGVGGIPEQHPHFDQLIIDALLLAIGRPEPVRGWSSRRRIVRRAEDLVCSSEDPPKTVSELCESLDVPLRTLEDAFQYCLGVGPKTYMTVMRLNRVRRLLARPGDDTSVTKAAMAMGFFHLGRFSEQYAGLFGERPSETLARARR